MVTKVYEPNLKVDKYVQLHELNSRVTLKTVLQYVDLPPDAELLVGNAP